MDWISYVTALVATVSLFGYELCVGLFLVLFESMDSIMFWDFDQDQTFAGPDLWRSTATMAACHYGVSSKTQVTEYLYMHKILHVGIEMEVRWQIDNK